MKASYDIVIVGGGLVGAAVAWGCARAGANVALLDGQDTAHRASRANMGQVWVQGKGETFRDYARLTQRSALSWQGFADQVRDDSGIDVEFQQPGGINFCLSQEELDARRSVMTAMEAQGTSAGMAMLTRAEAQDRVPFELGEAVVGASWCPQDGSVNPMRLMHALQLGMARAGGDYHSNRQVSHIEPDGTGFVVHARGARVAAGKVVIAAGLGSRDLAGPLGLSMPVWPYQGQLIITERARRLPPFLASALRQTQDGTFQIGTSRQDTQLDTSVQVETLQAMAKRALACVPSLRSLSMVRSWGGLRIMTPDGFPLYEESSRHPGAFAVTCHSGVTLAAVHALEVAPAVLRGEINQQFASFSSSRFDAKPVH